MSGLLSLASVFLIVLSQATSNEAAWRRVAEALKEKHTDQTVRIEAIPCVTNACDMLRRVKPRYVAFVMRSEELDEPSIRQLHRTMRTVDDDPFDDAIWGIVTGPTARDALRVARSCEPRAFHSVLATTGVDTNMVAGPVTVLQDHTPPPASEKDTSHRFVFGWNDDPELLLTSSHATETNLEMPFSRGMIKPRDGRFAATCALPMSEPKREKVWIAAGNCLIANPRVPGSPSSTDSMVMTAIGWGKVNQFFGYTVETWYGEIGWNTWRYFNAYRMSLSESWYAANQNLVRTLALKDLPARDRAGKEWDMDGTAFYGDPLQAIGLPPLASRPKWTSDALPLLVVFPSDAPKDRTRFPKDWQVFVADDFALVTKWTDEF